MDTWEDVREETGPPPPLGTEEEFHAMLADLSVAEAPRRFSLCEVEGERVDGWVFGWGLAFDDRAVVVTHSGLAGSFRSVDNALRVFSRARNLRLVWVDSLP